MRCLSISALLSLLSLSATAAVTCKPTNPLISESTLIYRLWTSSCDTVDAFLNNAFIQGQAAANQGSNVQPQALGALRYYFLQDYYYLWALVVNKANLISKAAFATETVRISYVNDTVASMSGDIDYAEDFRKDMMTKLLISQAQIDAGEPNQALTGYLAWLQTNTEQGRFIYDVSTIACKFGWAELAYRINQTNPGLNKGSPFYKLWVAGNADYSYGKHLSDRLEANSALANDKASFDTYKSLFQQGLRFETGFFNSALNKTIGMKAA